MGALAASTSSAIWLVEDDILLKNAVETGASLESLAKGAVCFSRKFTLQEIQDRWKSLLYDTEISTRASGRMVDYEIDLSSTNPAKAHKLFNSKAKDFSFHKRKVDSVKNLYYAMRKRVCNEPCNTVDLDFLIRSCPCIEAGRECVCGGLLKQSQGNHVVHNIEPGVNTMSFYGQPDGGFNGGQTMYPGINGHHFHMKHADSMVEDVDTTNNVPYGYSDVGQIYEEHAYTQKNPVISEGNNVSLQSNADNADFQDSMHYQNLASGNQCGNEVAESNTLVMADHGGVEHVHFPGDINSREEEPGTVQVIGGSDCSQAPGGWSGIEERGILTLDDDKKIKTANRDPLMLQPNLDVEISTSGLDHAALPESDYIDFRFFTNSEDFDLHLNGENFLNCPQDASEENLDDPDSKAIPGMSSTMQNLLHPDEANICCDQVDPGHVKHNAVDVSGIILVPTSLEIPYPGRYVECMLNTEDPEIPCNDDVIIPSESSLQCPTTAFGQNSEHSIYLVSQATSPPSNAECSNVSELALINMEDMASAPSSQPMDISPPTSEQKEGLAAPNKGCALGAKPSEGPSAGALVNGNIVANNGDTCTPALPCISAAGFAEVSPCSLGQHDNSHSMALLDSVEVPDHMNCNIQDNQPEVRDRAPLQSRMPSHVLPDLGLQDPVATVPTSAQAEECSENGNDVPNYYDLEALILDQDLIPWDQDSDSLHPEVTRFQQPECRRSLIRLEQGARSYMNRAIMSQGALAVIYGLHLKYYIRDLEVTLGRETEDIKVDIDLGKEGRANKISRRQAVIKMDEAGSFHIKNIGKCPIFVNSKEVPSCKRISLNSDSLIEIKDMRFIFHANQDAVRQHITHSLKTEC